jgi:hypothetical protein
MWAQRLLAAHVVPGLDVSARFQEALERGELVIPDCDVQRSKPLRIRCGGQ